MMIEVQNVNEEKTVAQIQAGKTVACLFRSRLTGTVNVCCQNASHRAFRGIGRTFRNWDEARKGYKSTAMKLIIDEAERILESN